MACLALLLAVLARGVPAQAAPASASEGPRDFRVFAYDVQLQIDRERKQITGRQTLHLRGVADRSEVITFPRNGIDVTSVTCRDPGGPHEAVRPVGVRNRLDAAAPIARRIVWRMASRAPLTLLGIFAGSLIYRSIRDGGPSWSVALDSAAVALISLVLIAAVGRFKKSKTA